MQFRISFFHCSSLSWSKWVQKNCKKNCKKIVKNPWIFIEITWIFIKNAWLFIKILRELSWPKPAPGRPLAHRTLDIAPLSSWNLWQIYGKSMVNLWHPDLAPFTLKEGLCRCRVPRPRCPTTPGPPSPAGSSGCQCVLRSGRRRSGPRKRRHFRHFAKS